MGRSEVTCSSLPPLLFSSDLCWYESVSLRLGLLHWHQWSHGSSYSWWIWSNGNVYSKKNSNVQEVLDKYSRYSNEKNQPWASSTNVTCLHHVLRISVESTQVLERFGFGNWHLSGWCFSASQSKLLDLPVCWTAQLWDQCLPVSAGLDMRHWFKVLYPFYCSVMHFLHSRTRTVLSLQNNWGGGVGAIFTCPVWHWVEDAGELGLNQGKDLTVSSEPSLLGCRLRWDGFTSDVCFEAPSVWTSICCAREWKWP